GQGPQPNTTGRMSQARTIDTERSYPIGRISPSLG
ncbi:unnamed protein product, partial [marine sediment metagenome]